MLYTLLLKARYGPLAAAGYGVLVYLRPEGAYTEVVNTPRPELRALLLARNRHAADMAVQHVRLPPLLRDPMSCSRCFSNTECMVEHRAREDGDEQSSGVGRLYNRILGHLTSREMAYFSDWSRMVDLEAKVGESRRRSVWSKSGLTAEESTSQCISQLTLVGSEEPSNETGGGYTHTFRRHGVGCKSLLELGISARDRVIISTDRPGTQRQHVRVLVGTVT
ncbi:unnamed protein product, partial [Chrysoparadoxa australica]